MSEYNPHIRLRPDYGECHQDPEDQPDACPNVPRGEEDDNEDENSKELNLKNSLIRLGEKHPDLRMHLKSILDAIK